MIKRGVFFSSPSLSLAGPRSDRESPACRRRTEENDEEEEKGGESLTDEREDDAPSSCCDPGEAKANNPPLHPKKKVHLGLCGKQKQGVRYDACALLMSP